MDKEQGGHPYILARPEVTMDFATLALIMLIGLVGPLLALPRRWQLPVVLGELGAGIVLGPTGLGRLDAGDSTFTFLADIGFALVMFVAGSRVPIRDRDLRAGLGAGALRAVGVGVAAAALGVVIANGFGTGHAAMYTVLMASSSAALVLPIVDSLHLGGTHVLRMLSQVAIADTATIVALPLAIDPKHAGRAALGALAVTGCAVALYFALRYIESTGIRRRVHHVSEERKFAIELRVNLTILFALAALAVRTHVSIMLAGFSFGLAVAAVGEPRRLARQLFAVTDGLFAPVFFVWLGASLNLRDLGRHPSYAVLGVALGAGALVAHTAMRLTGQPLAVGAVAAAQLGVPVAAVTVGTQQHLLHPGEGAGLLLGALITIAAAVACAGVAARAGWVAEPSRADRP
jgi:Kef-type K+ transport system membrane component KefB